MTQIRCDRTAAWGTLLAMYQTGGRALDLRSAFAQDPTRFERLSLQAPHVFADLSKNLIDAPIRAQLTALAQECGVAAHRDAMFRGEAINRSEDRAAMHWLLRQPEDATVPETHGVRQAWQVVTATRDAMLAYAQAVRADETITDVVHIGIGGSELGPQMVVQALAAYATPGKRMHFISGLDGQEIDAVLRPLKPEHTLFLVASKSFTTVETMTNARAARDWFTARGGRDVARHFWALTSNAAAASEFGIATRFDLWDWVGGRFSLWSAIGLPIAIAIGPARFRELLAGAHAMDMHFRNAALADNLPVQLALLDLWYRNFHGFGSRCVAPYATGLRRLPAFLQQLEMESNGKRVDMHGQALPQASAPVVWGESGINGQHAFFQMLHQGTDVVPVEFIVVRQLGNELVLPAHQPMLLSSVLAQAQALMLGRSDPAGHGHMPGNRPSSVLLLEALTPASVGALIALYEHRVFVAGSLWGINSFDQWGVEFGKQLAQGLVARLGSGDVGGLDASTAGLLRRLRGG